MYVSLTHELKEPTGNVSILSIQKGHACIRVRTIASERNQSEERLQAPFQAPAQYLSGAGPSIAHTDRSLEQAIKGSLVLGASNKAHFGDRRPPVAQQITKHRFSLGAVRIGEAIANIGSPIGGTVFVLDNVQLSRISVWGICGNWMYTALADILKLSQSF
jgi:hypothetical protein